MGLTHISHPTSVIYFYKPSYGIYTAVVIVSDIYQWPRRVWGVITIRAQQEGITPQQVVDKCAAFHEKVFVDLGISFNIFWRTAATALTQVSKYPNPTQTERLSAYNLQQTATPS